LPPPGKQEANTLMNFIFVGLIVLIGVAIASYMFIFREKFSGTKSYVASVVFGILSNPFWVLLLTKPV